MQFRTGFLGAVLVMLLFACADRKTHTDWPIYRGDEGSNAYSSLDQINISNVAQLKSAWTYRAGRASENTTLECNPLIIDGVVYGVSPTVRVFALDGGSQATRTGDYYIAFALPWPVL